MKMRKNDYDSDSDDHNRRNAKCNLGPQQGIDGLVDMKIDMKDYIYERGDIPLLENFDYILWINFIRSIK